MGLNCRTLRYWKGAEALLRLSALHICYENPVSTVNRTWHGESNVVF